MNWCIKVLSFSTCLRDLPSLGCRRGVWLLTLFSSALLLLAGDAFSQSVWNPTAGHVQVPIWPGPIPDARPTSGPEKAQSTGTGPLVAGRSWLSVERVSRPTLTVYQPQGKSTGAAIIVFPGGGYEVLAIDLEGTEVCDWLVAKGITCVLLKYRVPAPRSAPSWGAYPQSPMALQDAQRTISLVRFHAEEWHIDSSRIGVLGFSAGGHLVAATSVHYSQRLYRDVDAADKVSCRPDFAVALYPGHLALKPGTLALTQDIASRITKQTPPTFLLQNEDDPVDSVWNALSYYSALRRQGARVELHSYATGGHAFGLRKTTEVATEWPSLVERWLVSLGVLSKSSSHPLATPKLAAQT